jgi:hypothetical protein
MEVIIKPRRSGKTVELIKIANKEWKYIVCPDRQRAENIVKTANKLGLDIPYPIVTNELPLKSPFVESVLVDDADEVLRRLIGKDIKTITISC